MNIDNYRMTCGKRGKIPSQPINSPFTGGNNKGSTVKVKVLYAKNPPPPPHVSIYDIKGNKCGVDLVTSINT